MIKFSKVEKPGIDLKRLRHFIAVCDHGGFSRAATAIGIAQPALTQQIKLLETEIGMPLFIRSGRGAEPTEQGRFLLAKAREHLDGLDAVVHGLKQRFSTLSGQIVLGICPTIAPFFLDGLLAFLRDDHPNLTLSVIQAYSGDLKHLMDGQRLDIALTYRPGKAHGVECFDLFSERLVVVAGQDTGLAEPLSLQVISAMKLILPSKIHELRRIIDRVCAARGVGLKPELELDSLDAVKAMLLKPTFRYVTILPYHSIKHEVDGGLLACRAIDDRLMQRTIAVVLPKIARNAPVARFLAEYIRTQSVLLKARLGAVF